jgi:hypothetical protein
LESGLPAGLTGRFAGAAFDALGLGFVAGVAGLRVAGVELSGLRGCVALAAGRTGGGANTRPHVFEIQRA